MPQVINTNAMSLMARNNLNKSQGSLNTAIGRLSSGLRINSAKDDAAGQAIANRFTSNIRGLTQASRNANDGISISQTAEGALNEMNSNIQRIRELTVKAANGTNSEKDREAIQKEIDQRLNEIDRISNQTDFNGTKLFSKDAKNLVIQVGSNDKETITISLSEFNVDKMGLTGFKPVAATGSDEKIPPADDKDKGQSVEGQGVENKDDAGKTKTGTQADATADDQLKKLDDALAEIDKLRSQFGAAQNRFESAIASIDNTSTNLSSALSRIQDADYAEEVSNMTRNQILQQAGTSMLAQANQVPQLVLSLLQ